MKLKLITLVSLMLLAVACDPKSSPRKIDAQPIDPHSSLDGILDIFIQVDQISKTVKVRMENVPLNSLLVCAVDKEKVNDCKNSMELPYPEKNGLYVFTVVATVDRKVMAVGETKFRIGETGETSNEVGIDNNSPNAQFISELAMEVDSEVKINGRPFQNGMWIKMSEPLSLKFQFKRSPRCVPTIRCTSDTIANPFKPICDMESGKSYSSTNMARGLQHLKVQANCGDHVGTPLILYWYGVPDNYSYMSLSPTIVSDTAKNQKRYIFNLMKPSDCPENKLQFKCRESDKEPLKDCKNYIENPNPGYSIAPVCNGVIYSPFRV